jgi:HAD superfamily hydrolase (TIGR01484 family)
MMGRLLATDLDRTLLPNGPEEESPGARPLLAALAAELELQLAYVTGRRLELVEAAIEEYDLPRPHFVLADVGTSLYAPRGAGWELSPAWTARLAEDWDGRTARDLAPLLAGLAAGAQLELQEPAAQGEFKLSFYTPLEVDAEALVHRVRAALAGAGLRAAVVHSVDAAARTGLLDVLPACSAKLRALEHLMAARGVARREVVFAGDSGNDLEVLVSPIPAVLVANADEDLRARALREAADAGFRERLYAARGGLFGMNGNYAAGILEGWVHFHPEDTGRLAALAGARAGGGG